MKQNIPPLHGERLVIPVILGTLHVHIRVHPGFGHDTWPSNRFPDLLRQVDEQVGTRGKVGGDGEILPNSPQKARETIARRSANPKTKDACGLTKHRMKRRKAPQQELHLQNKTRTTKKRNENPEGDDERSARRLRQGQESIRAFARAEKASLPVIGFHPIRVDDIWIDGCPARPVCMALGWISVVPHVAGALSLAVVGR